MHEVDVELVHAEAFQLVEFLYVVLDGAEDAEALDDVVRDEVRRGVVCFAVVAVVVALARPYVVGQGVRDLAFISVARDQVGDVVADHPAEPPALVALVGEIFSDVGGGGDADFYVPGVAARFRGGVVDVAHGPLEDHGIGELQDEAVGLASDGAERLRTVPGHPHVELAIFDPRDADLRAVVVYLPAFRQFLDDVHRLFDLGEPGRFPPQNPLGRVAAADTADRAVAEHVVEGGEGGGCYRGVAGGGVGDQGSDRYPLRGGEDLGVDDVRFLPEDVRVESPGVGEAERLGPLGQLDDAPGWRVGLQGYAEVHASSLSPLACATTRGTLCSARPRPASPGRCRRARRGRRPGALGSSLSNAPPSRSPSWRGSRRKS